MIAGSSYQLLRAAGNHPGLSRAELLRLVEHLVPEPRSRRYVQIGMLLDMGLMTNKKTKPSYALYVTPKGVDHMTEYES